MNSQISPASKLEALWEILSPSPELRDHIETYKQLAQLYATVRNAYATGIPYVIDLANKTRSLIQDSAVQKGLGYPMKTVTFDVSTLEALRGESGSDEAKVFNLVRGLHREIEDNRDAASVLRPLKDRAEQVLNLHSSVRRRRCGRVTNGAMSFAAALTTGRGD